MVEDIIGQGGSSPPDHIPFTPRSKKVLELSLRESLELGHDYIGTEHILLGLIREGESVAATVLVKLGADLCRVRQQVIELLAGYEPPGRQPAQVAPQQLALTTPESADNDLSAVFASPPFDKFPHETADNARTCPLGGTAAECIPNQWWPSATGGIAE